MIYGYEAGGNLRRFRSGLNGAKKAIAWGAAPGRRLYVLKNRRFSPRSYKALRGRFESFSHYCVAVLDAEAKRVTPEDLRRIYLG